MATTYSHQTAAWPHYAWDHAAFSKELADVHFRRGQLVVAMAALGVEARQETMLSVLVQDVVKSSEIEGEHLDAQQVRSSISRRLGLDAAGLPAPARDVAGLPAPARDVEGVVEMMLDATQRYAEPLNAERVFGWHAALFPTGRSGIHKIRVGQWRDDSEGPMQVVSGRVGKEKVHYEAPSAERVPEEMETFFGWFETAVIDPVLSSAIAHLWFVSIHPLDDGNGRIGRAVMDMALARADGTDQRFYSMSSMIFADRAAYYNVLERSQKSGMDVTDWIVWFLGRMDAALASAEGVVESVRRKQKFWDDNSGAGLNERQTKIVNMLIDGFRGLLQASKYAAITKVSHDTALRDLSDLVNKEILVPLGQGRGAHYELRP